MHILLRLAPTYISCRRGRHNSPSADTAGDFIFHSIDICHVTVDTVHPSLLWPSPYSSARRYHIQCLFSDVWLASPVHVSKPHQSNFPSPLCDVLYVHSLPYVIIFTWSLNVRTHTHLHISISVTSSVFSLELFIGSTPTT